MKHPAIILDRVTKTKQSRLDEVVGSSRDSKLTPPKQKPEACLIDTVLITTTIYTIITND